MGKHPVNCTGHPPVKTALCSVNRDLSEDESPCGQEPRTLEPVQLRLNPGSAAYQLGNTGQGSQPLWASVSPSAKQGQCCGKELVSAVYNWDCHHSPGRNRKEDGIQDTAHG